MLTRFTVALVLVFQIFVYSDWIPIICLCNDELSSQPLFGIETEAEKFSKMLIDLMILMATTPKYKF